MKGATWRLQRKVPSLQDQFGPREGAASHTTKGPRRKKKKTIFRFIEGGKGGGGGAIKCFCFVYKERDFRRPLLKEEGGTSPPTTSSSKAKPRRGEGYWRGRRTPNTPSNRSHKLSPPTLNASTPGDPSGMRKGVCTQVGVALGWGRGNNLSAEAVGSKGVGGSRLVTVVA